MLSQVLMDAWLVSIQRMHNALVNHDHLNLATIHSPEFDGVPKAPTALVSANDTQIANTAHVKLVVAALIDAAPGTLDTLNELAAAIADDASYAATITTALGLKAPLSSPALTGTPTVPTATAGTNTTQAASTAFVKTAIDNSNLVFHARHSPASGTDGGTLTAASFQTRPIDTVVLNTIPGASLATNQVTLPAGTYETHGGAMGNDVGLHVTRLYNVTDAVSIPSVAGKSSNTTAATGIATESTFTGRFTLAATKVIEVQHFCSITKTTNGMGAAVTSGELENYLDLFIKKVG